MIDPNHPVPQPVLTGDIRQPKPQAVTNGVLLFYAALCVSLIGNLINMLQPAPNTNPSFRGGMLFGLALFFVVMAAITNAAGQGKNWARITLLVVFCIFVPFALFGVVIAIRSMPLAAAFTLVQQVLEAISVFFLFSKPASEWYKSIR